MRIALLLSAVLFLQGCMVMKMNGNTAVMAKTDYGTTSLVYNPDAFMFSVSTRTY